LALGVLNARAGVKAIVQQVFAEVSSGSRIRWQATSIFFVANRDFLPVHWPVAAWPYSPRGWIDRWLAPIDWASDDDRVQAAELACIEGLAHQEIAIRRGEPVGRVKPRVRLGTQTLKDILGSDLGRIRQSNRGNLP
jgi:hypothetical protein